MIDLVSRTDDLAVLANGFAQRVPQVMARVPVELQSSFVLSLRLHQLQVVLASLSAPQILALHRGLLEESSKEQMFQQLVALQKTLQAQPLSNLRNVHQMYRDEQGPDCDRNALANLLGIGPKEFFVVELVRQVLSLDAEGVKSLREVLSLFSAAHLNLLVDLLVLHDFGALEMRALFVDVMIEEPEAFLGGGFGLGLSTGAMDVGQDEEVEEDEELLQAAVRVEIVEQPPKACVYRRNVRPSPEVHVKVNKERGFFFFFLKKKKISIRVQDFFSPTKTKPAVLHVRFKCDGTSNETKSCRTRYFFFFFLKKKQRVLMATTLTFASPLLLSVAIQWPFLMTHR